MTRIGHARWLCGIAALALNASASHCGERVETGPMISIAQVWSDRPLARVGDRIRFSAFVENRGSAESQDVTVTLAASAGIAVEQPSRPVGAIPAGSYSRIDWLLRAQKPGRVELTVSAPGCDSADYRVLVIGRSAKHTRQELCTDADGFWRLLERPSTLQQGNLNPVAPVKHKKSSEIKRNTYGICTHLPRSREYEDPFDPRHLIDGNPDTYWSSQQNSSSYPGTPPWAEIDLGKAVRVTQVNFVPYWKNTDFPIGFSVRASLDGTKWDTVRRETGYQLRQAGSKRGDKVVQPFALNQPVQARRIRIDFERLPLSEGFYCEVSQGYKARLSGIEVIDEQGHNAALSARGASVRVSDVFTGWRNTVRSVSKSFDRIFDIGLKWVRVGQWGDQTEWAAVERKRGEFSIDPACDAGIRKLLENRVDILYGLNYGNALHEPMDAPWKDIGPTFTEGHPFYKNCGPRTEEGRQAFVRYVDFAVRKYGDRIKWWELWNEQNGWYPGNEAELYGKLLYAVAKHIKSLDPSLKVMFGGTAMPAPITTEISLREGAAPYVDACAFHPYGIDKPEGGMGTLEHHGGEDLSQTREQTGWNCLEDIVEGVRKPFAQHGKRDIQVWVNEYGSNVAGLDFTYRPGAPYYKASGFGEYCAAKYLMRFYIYAGWLNMPMAWWALYNQNKSQDWGILDQRDYSFRPMAHALQNICSVVSDVRPVRSLKHSYDGPAPDPKVISYERDGSGDTLVLVWAAEISDEEVKSYPSKLSFALETQPKQVCLIDLYWGVTQPAVWSYENGMLTINGLIVRDYPIVIDCQ